MIFPGGISMKLSSLMLTAACIAMLPTSHDAVAQENPGSAMNVMRGCRSYIAETSKDVFLQGVCVGTVLTLVDLGEGVCFPKGETVEQAVRAVAAYIDSQPLRLLEDFRILTLEALRNAWPCKR
jgi:Rap1a immunity proteins